MHHRDDYQHSFLHFILAVSVHKKRLTSNNAVCTILGANKRVYFYGAIVAISAIGIIHFKQSLSQRDEIQIFSQHTSINKIDLITTELPLLIAPFAGIDAIHYLTEIIYDLNQNHQINQQRLN